jgi:hypothetical protein
MSRQDRSLLEGTEAVAIEPLPEEAHLAYHLLESAGMHPILAYHDDSGVPHPLDPEAPFTGGSGLMVPVTTTYAVYVPESEAPGAQQVLKDAERSAEDSVDGSVAGTTEDDGDAGPAGPEGADQD